jgi:hypothetical protein
MLLDTSGAGRFARITAHFARLDFGGFLFAADTDFVIVAPFGTGPLAFIFASE